MRGSSIGKRSAALAAQTWGPRLTAGYVRGVLDQAIDGEGPIRSAAGSATARRVECDGDVEDAVNARVSQHVEDAAAQGLGTKTGGFAPVAVAVPGNIT